MRTIDADELIKFFPDNGEGAWTYNITAQGYINAMPTVDQWHYPSKGELPKGSEVWDGYKIIYYLPDLKRWYRFEDDEPIETPYAWCYLPDPPKEE